MLVNAADEVSPADFWAHRNIVIYLLIYSLNGPVWPRYDLAHDRSKAGQGQTTVAHVTLDTDSQHVTVSRRPS